MSQLVKEHPDKTEYQLLVGLAHLDSGQYHEALRWLKSVSEQGRTYEVVGLWYLGLAYLAMNQSEVAVRYFERLLDINNSVFIKRAKNTIKNIRR